MQGVGGGGDAAGKQWRIVAAACRCPLTWSVGAVASAPRDEKTLLLLSVVCGLAKKPSAAKRRRKEAAALTAS